MWKRAHYTVCTDSVTDSDLHIYTFDSTEHISGLLSVRTSKSGSDKQAAASLSATQGFAQSAPSSFLSYC